MVSSRREFLKKIGQAGILCCVPSLSRAAGFFPDTVCVSILHTTDLHGHILPTVDYDGNPNLGGLARCVTQIRRWRKQNPNSILIDVGDVYQGTDLGLRSKGELMIDLFNYLKYDAWVVGNHEFDWGLAPFLRSVEKSTMPVLAANALLEEKNAGEIYESGNPLSKIRPYILKKIAGIKIAIIGVTTPGLPFWFRPEFIRGFDVQYPVEPVRRAIVRAKSEGANAIVVAGHMGLKTHTGGDDFANNVTSLTSEFQDVAVFIAGHTHQLIASRMMNGVLVTQADHFGIHAGRVDLYFNRETKRLVLREAHCELMDKRFRIDPVVVSRIRTQLDESHAALGQPIGELAETLRVRAQPGVPSEVERIIGAATMEMLRDRGTTVDGAFHGLFDEKNNAMAGRKTVDDVWNIIPFENYIVTASLLPEEIKMVMDEVYITRDRRSLLGFDVQTTGSGTERRIASITLDDGRPLEREKRYTIAFNSFDSRSAGHRFMKLRELLETPAVDCRLHDVQTRDALIEYFRRHKIVHRIPTHKLREAA